MQYAACYASAGGGTVSCEEAMIVQAFGKRIAAIRKECGLSQVGLGRQTGLGQPRLSRIEKGELAGERPGH